MAPVERGDICCTDSKGERSLIQDSTARMAMLTLKWHRSSGIEPRLCYSPLSRTCVISHNVVDMIARHKDDQRKILIQRTEEAGEPEIALTTLKESPSGIIPILSS